MLFQDFEIENKWSWWSCWILKSKKEIYFKKFYLKFLVYKMKNYGRDVSGRYFISKKKFKIHKKKINA